MELMRIFIEQGGLSEAVATELVQQFSYTIYKKGESVIGFGKGLDRLYYVESGLVRFYYEKDGKDITQDFFPEGKFFLPLENLFLNDSFPYHVEALETTKIASIAMADIQVWIDREIKLQRLNTYLLSAEIKKLRNRLFSQQFQSAQERYHLFLKHFPTIVLRAPLGHVASYLGITQSTLSVIRAELHKWFFVLSKKTASFLFVYLYSTNEWTMRKIDALLEEYGESHQNATNKRVHWICVPLIFFTIYGLIRTIPVPTWMSDITLDLSWASIMLAFALLYYCFLSLPLTVGFLCWSLIVFAGNEFLYLWLGATGLLFVSVSLFALAWIGQFIGHGIEGKKPSFFKDLQFLLIGPAWLMSFIYKRLEIQY